MTNNTTDQEIFDPEASPSLKSWGEPTAFKKQDVAIECGWGRLLFAHTFQDHDQIVDLMSREDENARDLALYVRDPQVIIAKAPQNLFIDPSYTFRLALDSYKPLKKAAGAFSVRLINVQKDVESINRIYQMHNMVPVDPDFAVNTYQGTDIKYWVCVEDDTKDIIGVSMGVDHKLAFNDPENGSSLWSVAVDPQAKHAGIGLEMIQHIAHFYQQQGRAFLDLSVMHNNEGAISLYKKLGFVQVPVFCIKNKNPVNEKLFTAPEPEKELNPYAMIIINEARRRGIRVNILDEIDNYFELSKGGTSIVCNETLTQLTSSIAMSRCQNKNITTRVLHEAGLNVPKQHLVSTPSQNHAFLKQHGNIVVKPSVGEQGSGITVNVKTKNELETAIIDAQEVSRGGILEQMVEGQDLRVVVIGFEVIAAAYRKPPYIVGDGKQSIQRLIQKLSRRRSQATNGISKIRIDKKLKREIHNRGYVLEDILPKGEELRVRREPNLHFGGTLHDVTDILHPAIKKAAEDAARALDVPVAGVDMIVQSAETAEYFVIGVNERPGLAHHEPQPTAERFIDFLFPQSIAATE